MGQDPDMGRGDAHGWRGCKMDLLIHMIRTSGWGFVHMQQVFLREGGKQQRHGRGDVDGAGGGMRMDGVVGDDSGDE